MDQVNTHSSISASISANNNLTMSLVVKLKVRTIVKQANGMLDPRPRGLYIETLRQNLVRSPLLRLPPEIRNIIFRYVLGGLLVYLRPRNSNSESSKILQNAIGSVGFFPFKKNYLAILSACRQTYTETALLPFALNIWAWHWEIFEYWRNYDKVLEAQINAVTIMDTYRYILIGENLMQGLALFPNIKKIYVAGYKESWASDAEAVDRRCEELTRMNIQVIWRTGWNTVFTEQS